MKKLTFVISFLQCSVLVGHLKFLRTVIDEFCYNVGRVAVFWKCIFRQIQAIFILAFNVEQFNYDSVKLMDHLAWMIHKVLWTIAKRMAIIKSRRTMGRGMNHGW